MVVVDHRNVRREALKLISVSRQIASEPRDAAKTSKTGILISLIVPLYYGVTMCASRFTHSSITTLNLSLCYNPLLKACLRQLAEDGPSCVSKRGP